MDNICESHGRLRCSECAYVIELEERVKELEKDNKRLSDLNHYNNLPAMKSMVEEIEQYKQILEFYADEDNYFRRVIPPVIESEVVQDKGEKARKALKGESE
ncbi:hypothetical protein [Virgibacillus sp. Bac332]|uniref:hypothetical protein n=1 Tax=Virgibacillus sp. Bac332 TaxID=2419842 RepID=UPI000EF4F0A9|nr:hypothetical protein [Virgibacillus sp. Bac332]